MNYTVNKLATLSGVSIRTLRFYDEIDLLKPAFIGDNGYRYYQEQQLLLLQQILFFRELGFELKQIQRILGQSDFDKIEALRSHKKVLRKRIGRMETLMTTIDKTINHLQGQPMKDKEMYRGFDPEKQKEYEKYLLDHYGEAARKGLAESKENTKNWTKADHDRAFKQAQDITIELIAAIEKKLTPDSPTVQKLIAKHYVWMKQFWTPNKEAYIGLGQLYLTNPEFRKMWDAKHPKIAQFYADAMKVYAERELA